MNQAQHEEFRALKLDGERVMSRIAGVLDRVPDEAYTPKTTIQDVYGTESPVTPAGFRQTGEFRVPKPGEPFIMGGRGFYLCAGHCFEGYTFIEPYTERLILEPVPPTVESVYGKPLAELRPPAGWRLTGEFRVPRARDTTLTPGYDDAFMWREVRASTTPRLLLARAQRLVLDVVDTDRPPCNDEWCQCSPTGPIYKCTIASYETTPRAPVARVFGPPRLEDVPEETQ